jgi:DNA primase catalytic core
MARIPDELIERIKREVPLEKLCAHYGLQLSPRGKDLAAKCPFHEDRDPSFIVSPKKNLWNCLAGCGGGDNLQLVMRLEKCSFRYAAEQLLKMLGVAPEAAAVTTRMGTTHEILAAPGDGLSDAQLMQIVTDFYHTTFLNQPPAMQYLARRKCFHPEAVKRFKIGYANRTLGYRVPTTTTAGRELKARLQKLGVLRKETGHEHLNGSVVFPICDRHGQTVQLYGRKITDGLRKGTPLHLYLEAPKRGVWNAEAVMSGGEVILCEAILDALTFWCAGFRNVTCSFGAGSVNEDLWALLHDVRPRWLVCAQDNDPAGNDAVAKLAPRLAELGIGVKRVQLPAAVDVNAYACQSADAAKALAALLEQAHVLVTHAAESSSRREEALTSVAADAAPEPAAKEEKAAVSDTTPASSPETAVAPPQAQPLSSLAASVQPPPVPATPTATPGNGALHPEHKGEDIFFKIGDREYRVRGLAKNTSFEALKVNLRVKLDEERHHQDNVDLNSAKNREAFIRAAAAETHLQEDIFKRDLSRLLLKLEELQEELIRRALEPKGPVVPGLTEEERREALAFLQAPNLRALIVEHFRACGVVGEADKIETGYYAALSRKFDKPPGVIIQSTSAAGKTTLMEAILAMMPPEEVVQYSAMTGQALFYLGEADIQHKILAIAEEEGAERATYALKLLQSEGRLTIASTGKDATTGRLITETYRVEGPAMIFFTTTSIELDEELANRCLTLTVDESREQTRRIHELQREEETIEGHLHKARAAALRKLHQNAQRLLQTIPVHNPFARQLTFPDESTRLRRDQKKYLTLIRAIALLHQHQRPRRKVEGVEHVEVTLEDIATANRLAGEVLGRSLDEMPPQTRRFLDLLHDLVTKQCQAQEIQPRHYRFTQRQARAFTGWTAFQVKKHLAKLVDLEYVLIHRGSRGQQFVYELVYTGEGRDGASFLPGLIDVAKLKGSTAAPAVAADAPSDAPNSKLETHNSKLPYDGNREHPNGDREHRGSPEGAPRLQGGSTEPNPTSPNANAGETTVSKKQPRKSRPGSASETPS